MRRTPHEILLEAGDCVLNLNNLLSEFAGSPKHKWHDQLLELYQFIMDKYWEL